MIMKGGDSQDWSEYREKEKKKSRANQPWADWSTDDLKTEWETSDESVVEQETSKKTPSPVLAGTPPGNQKALHLATDKEQESENEEPTKYKHWGQGDLEPVITC